MRRKLIVPPPLAERLWFVVERGTAGWVKSASEPTLWSLWDESGLWRLSDSGKIDLDSWVLPFCQFKLAQCFWATDEGMGQAIFTRALARFPRTPRRNAPPLVPAVPPRTPAPEQLSISL
jgi:hypothetical protein